MTLSQIPPSLLITSIQKKVASLVAQTVKNLPAIQRKQKRELGLREEVTALPSLLVSRRPQG